jgi:predicted transglutaminase-like cysteine proteinase
MKIKTAVGAAILAAAIQTNAALATNNVNPQIDADNSLFTAEYDDTLPPVGYVNFCVSNQSECQSYSFGSKLSAKRLTMNPDRWNMLYQVNSYVNGKIKPMSDQELYGEAERWAYPVNAGDCEDYLLLKKRELEAMDIPAQNLRITVVLDENNQGHAILTVTTDEGDYILDNRRNDILLWNDTNYTFLKRQSAKDPRRWVALLKKPATASSVTSASQKP